MHNGDPILHGKNKTTTTLTDDYNSNDNERLTIPSLIFFFVCFINFFCFIFIGKLISVTHRL